MGFIRILLAREKFDENILFWKENASSEIFLALTYFAMLFFKAALMFVLKNYFIWFHTTMAHPYDHPYFSSPYRNIFDFLSVTPPLNFFKIICPPFGHFT